jgi:hypothetical protein
LQLAPGHSIYALLLVFLSPSLLHLFSSAQSGFEQCYNAQPALDSDGQLIIASGLTNNAANNGELLPLVQAVEKNLGELPKSVGRFGTSLAGSLLVRWNKEAWRPS